MPRKSKGKNIPISTKNVIKKKTSSSMYLIITIIAIIIFLAVIALNLYNTSEIQNIENEIIPSITPETVQSGGFCKIDTECFITSCKGQAEDCINVTQLTFYSNNCKTYSDWIVGKQDASRCSCIQNACIMR